MLKDTERSFVDLSVYLVTDRKLAMNRPVEEVQ